MQIKWTSKALGDLARLHEFLVPLNKIAAARAIQSLVKAPAALTFNPRIGEKLDEFLPREVRRIFVANYEIRYEVNGDTVFILRIWHTREQR